MIGMSERSMSFAERLAEGPPLLLDAAMGSELERRGLPSDLPLWSACALIASPEAVVEIHRENVAAGAEILTANTFRTGRIPLGAAGLGDRAKELTAHAVALARRAAEMADRRVFVAGSVAPLQDCYRPDLVPSDPVLEEEHCLHVANLIEAGVDLLLVETMNTVRELRVASGAAAATGLPVVASVVTDGAGRLLSGEPVEEAARAALRFLPAAIGVNCVRSASLGAEIGRLGAVVGETPMIAYANILSEADSPIVYAERAATWVEDGVRIVGGCCGTTAAHIAALRRRLQLSERRLEKILPN